MITYSELIASVQPFFLSRGGDELASPDRMLFYANTALQDAYNIDQATFTYATEEGVVSQDNGNTNKFETINSIRKIQECIGYYSNGSSIELRPTLFIQGDSCNDWCKFETGSNIIVTHKDITSISIVYTKEYKWAKFPEDMTSPIQVPNRYIPAVIKMMMDWASPINLMTGEASTVDFFSHAMKRFKELSDDDSLTDMYHINA